MIWARRWIVKIGVYEGKTTAPAGDKRISDNGK
jgi:hypothetical protein